MANRFSHVMLIDDNELDNFINKKLLETENFCDRISIHQSAQAALDQLQKISDENDEMPQIIFLDIVMPGMDGFGFLDNFDKLNTEAKNSIRVIMLSTSESFKDLNRANQNKYVRKFLNKPLTAAALKALAV